ncbi:MAG: hypothetical protein MI976_31935 [Pseudomonadales bacterium]|nr:hypothetical protein [Pseudomonadales bacterium]
MSIKQKVISTILTGALLALTGCNLTVDIEGEGKVVDLNSSFSCEQPTCELKHQGSIKEYALQAVPAEGYTNIGILSPASDLYRATDTYYYRTDIGYELLLYSFGEKPTSRVSQGRIFLPSSENVQPAGTPTPHFNVTLSDHPAAIFMPTSDILSIHHGNLSSCVHLVEDDIQCWGRRFQGEPEDFQNIYYVTTNGNTMCAADDMGLRCWGSGRYELDQPPEGLFHVQEVLFADRQACALYTESGLNKVTCWGDDAPTLPPLNNPTDLWATNSLGYTICATHDDGDICWGGGYFQQSVVPSEITNVTAFSVAPYHTCVIHSGAVSCWGEESSATDVPESLSNPTAISTSMDGTCVIDDNGIACWGNPYIEIPVLEGQPRQVKVNGISVCAADETTLTCTFGTSTGPDYDLEYRFTDLKDFEVNYSNVCYIDGSLAGCINLDYYNEQLQALVNPTAISRYSNYLCHLSDSGVFCDDRIAINNAIEDVPALTIAPTGVNVMTAFACAYESNSDTNKTYMQCWGEFPSDGSWSYHNRGQLSIPENLGMLSSVESGFFHTCGLSGSELYCWGEAVPPKE